MTDETTKKRKRRTRANDPKFDLRKRLDRFLDNPTNRSTLDSLVSGLVDYELYARLLAVLPVEAGTAADITASPLGEALD